jgi:hypothetical protein
MSYINAEECLPPDLLLEVQAYVQGSLVYIPCGADSARRGWGERSGARESLDKRNTAIREAKACGSSIDELADAYSLSPGGIRKILYGKKPN